MIVIKYSHGRNIPIIFSQRSGDSDASRAAAVNYIIFRKETTMKRITCALLAACMMLAILGVTAVSAAQNATGTVNQGTPVLDGQVDDIYKASLTIIAGGDQENGLPKHQPYWDKTMTATAYALYDADYIYLAAEVTDNDVVAPADDYMSGTNPMLSDCVDFRLCVDGKTTAKVSVDAFGKRLWGNVADEGLYDYSTISGERHRIL